MKFVETGFDGLYVIALDLKRDQRGFFARTFCEKAFGELGLEQAYVQGGTAFNDRAGTVRGMHFQRAPHGEVKLIRCTRGAIQDTVIDVRPASATYLKSFSVRLSDVSATQLYVPKGFAHGYQTLVDNTEVHYMMSTHHVAEAATGLRWDDPALDVRWPQAVTVISERDSAWPLVVDGALA